MYLPVPKFSAGAQRTKAASGRASPTKLETWFYTKVQLWGWGTLTRAQAWVTPPLESGMQAAMVRNPSPCIRILSQLQLPSLSQNLLSKQLRIGMAVLQVEVQAVHHPIPLGRTQSHDHSRLQGRLGNTGLILNSSVPSPQSQILFLLKEEEWILGNIQQSLEQKLLTG